MENACIFPSISHSTEKCNKTCAMGKVRKIDTHTFPIVWVLFLPLDFHPMVYFILRDMHGFRYQFHTLQQNTTRPMVWGKTGKLILILFPQYGCLFFIRFPSYGILHHIGNAQVSSSISHSTGKCNKTHYMGRTWEISTHIFPIVWVLFPHQIPILWCTSSFGKSMGFPFNFP